MKKRPYHLCAAAIITSVIAFPVQGVMMAPWSNYKSLTKELRDCEPIKNFKALISELKEDSPDTCFLHYMGATQNDIPRNKELFDTYRVALCKPGSEACKVPLEAYLKKCDLSDEHIDKYIDLYNAAETHAQDIVTKWFEDLIIAPHKITEEQRKKKNFCRDGQCATLLYTLDPKDYSGSIINFGTGSYRKACDVTAKDPIYTTLSVNRYFKCSD